jgi:hypothetical protein
MQKMTPAVVLALLALLFAWSASPQTAPEEPPPGEPPPAEPAPVPEVALTRWSDRHRGLAVRYPRSWSLRTSHAECLGLSSPDGTHILISEGNRRGARIVSREHGRLIQAEIRLSVEPPAETLAAAEAILASVRLRRSGRCGLPERPIRWRESRALGSPGWGQLVNGVKLPAQGMHFFTWDPVRRSSPNRSWRRWGTDGLVRTTLRVINRFAAAHPFASRVGIGDLSRPRGGDFGPKHATHTNGLDVDVYYPRKDGRERPPRHASQVDRRLAQELVDLFVAAGASRVYVGPNVGLSGPRGVIRVIPNHDNHLHARIPHWRA